MANSTKLLIFTLVILSLSIVFVGCMPDFSFLDDGGGTTAYEHPGSASTTARTTAKTTAKTSVTYATSYYPGGSAYAIRDGEPGYTTIDGVTFFYLKITYPHDAISVYVEGSDYGNYVNRFMMSFDKQNWQLCSYGSDNKFSAYVSGNTVYVSYCSVTNCADPDAVLDDLIENVFGNNDYCSITVSNTIGDETGVAPGEVT